MPSRQALALQPRPKAAKPVKEAKPPKAPKASKRPKAAKEPNDAKAGKGENPSRAEKQTKKAESVEAARRATKKSVSQGSHRATSRLYQDRRPRRQLTSIINLDVGFQAVSSPNRLSSDDPKQKPRSQGSAPET